MKAVCARCKAEGKSGIIGERPPLDDTAETYGICWTHKLELLARTRPSFGVVEGPRGDRWLRFVVIVARHDPELFQRVSEQFLRDSRVRVLADRRARERRQRAELRDPDRRAADRRRVPDYWEDLRYHPVIIVPTWKQADWPAGTPTGVGADSQPADAPLGMESVDVLAPAMERLEGWMREGQELFGRLVPALLDECEALQRRTDAAERRMEELGRTLEGLQAEVVSLQAELDSLRRGRTETADSVRGYMTEVVRLAGDMLVKIRATTD